MTAATPFIAVLCAESVGRVFGWNVIDHIETGHLDEEVFSKAWTYCVDNGGSPPARSERVIYLLQRWPGEPGVSYPGLPVSLAGLKHPPELGAWAARTLFNVTPTDRVTARKNKDPMISGAPATSTPLPPAKPFMTWLSTPVPGTGSTCDDVRDLLGLVHRTFDNGDDLTLLEYPPGAIPSLSRPTPLDSGANTRFCAVSEEEWASRAAAPPFPDIMGKAANLRHVRAGASPVTEAHEAVALVGPDLIDLSSAERHLGPVTVTKAADDASNDSYEEFLSRSRPDGTIERFLEAAYRPA